MNTSSSTPMPDVQSSVDTRHIAIDKVGIKNVRYPAQVATPSGTQATVAMWNLYVYLPETQKGTHMSRFVAMLGENANQHRAALDFASLQNLTRDMLQRLEAPAGRLEVSFPYFVNKTAPVSGVQSLMDYQVSWACEKKLGANNFETTLTVLAPVMSLCPCSKEISDYGAHNQRSHIIIAANLQAALTPEALINIAEEEASCQLWGLLKRPDEKYVTERAYDNPKFVEDLVRDVAARLKAVPQISGFTLEAENFESIHNHSAYALIKFAK